jgi:hypothetical protein
LYDSTVAGQDTSAPARSSITSTPVANCGPPDTSEMRNRVMQICLVMIGGFLAWIAGYVNTNAPLTPELLVRMKWMLNGVQFITVNFAAAVLWFFPISRERAEKTRRILEERKSQAPLADAMASSVTEASRVK